VATQRHVRSAARTRSITSVTCAGTATPIVSASEISNGCASATRFAISTTRETGTSPSNGQPNAAEIVTWARIPARRASADLGPRSDRLVGRDALVAPVERIARDDGHADLGTARRRRALEPLRFSTSPM
jgi:hypothetical protein